MHSKHASVPAVTAAYKPFMTEYRLAYKDPTSTLQKGRTWKRLRKMGVGKIEPTQTTTQHQQQHQQQSQQKQDDVRFRAVEKANDYHLHAAKLPMVNELMKKKEFTNPQPPHQQRGDAAPPTKKQQDRSKQTDVLDRLPDIYTNIHGINSNKPEDMSLMAGAGFHHYDLVGPLHVWQRQDISEGSYEPTSLMLPGMVHPQPPKVNHSPRRRVLGVTSPMVHIHSQRYNIISGESLPGEPHSGYKEGRRAVIQSFAHIDWITNARTPGYNIITGYDPLAHLSPEELAKLDLNLIK